MTIKSICNTSETFNHEEKNSDKKIFPNLIEIKRLTNEKAISLFKENISTLNENQLKAILTVDGPIQIVAGPGTGKTTVLVLRALYLLLTGKAEPHQIVLTTFTEKATYEIKDKLNYYANKCGYIGPLYEMQIGTIHSICNSIIKQNITYSPLLNKNYQVLDDLTQSLFLYDNFDKIVTNHCMINNLYFGKWNFKWETIKQLIPYFNKITEEIVDINKLFKSEDNFLLKISYAYKKYIEMLFTTNKIDYALQQKIVYDLLDSECREKIKADIKYIMVDEYQDTNFVQEQIFLKLTNSHNNICIVGDEDQSLYRFRGATVRNILEFSKHFKNTNKIVLDINYRSHPIIINAYNNFMKEIDWSNPNSDLNFRFNKNLRADPTYCFTNYPAIFSMFSLSKNEEAAKFANMIKSLKDNKTIEDYSEVALLLHSVRLKYSGHYIEALENLGIPYFVPRAKRFFENKEVKMMIGCYALILNFQQNISSNTDYTNLKNYCNDAITLVKSYYKQSLKLEQYIYSQNKSLQNLKKGEVSNNYVIDLFYELLVYSPFSTFINDDNAVRNLSKLSHFLKIFQNYYHIEKITEMNREWIPKLFFTSFLNFLMKEGIDDYEDLDNPIPRGHVQILTIHESKGLEFPVVIVGSLDKKIQDNGTVPDRYLKQFYHRPVFEPENRIKEFDTMRQYYVAFSRASKILILTTSNQPNYLASSLYNRLIEWTKINKKVLYTQKFNSKIRFNPKKSYSLTSHINTFELCPLRYQFYKEYDFSPSRSAPRTFGSLVHNTIEEIHTIILDQNKSKLTIEYIKDFLFENNYKSLIFGGLQPLSQAQKYSALDQVINYFIQNYDILAKIVKAEVNVSVEKLRYILSGKIDLIFEENGSYNILDFKTDQKPENDDPLLQLYYKQLYIYAYILKERHGVYPKRLYIYWTAMADKEQALVEIPFNENDINRAGEYFDSIITFIQNKEFKVKEVPKPKICRECDFKSHCIAEGIIKLKRS